MLGKAKTHTSTKNCGLCKKYLQCKDKKKSVMYLCSLFKSGNEIVKKKSTKKPKPSKMLEIPDIKVDSYDNKSYKHFSKMMDKIIKEQESNPVPPDLVIDDRDFPQAANFFEWVTDPRFLGMKITPFSKQLQIGTNLFSEWCPDCSDPKLIMDEPRPNLETPVRMSPTKFLERVQLLRHGKCPKCGQTKLELYKQNKLPIHNELVGVAGQRASKCVSGDTLVLTTKGFVDIKTILTGQKRGINGYDGEYKVVDEDGIERDILRTYISEKHDDLYKVLLSNGWSLEATLEHPIFRIKDYYKVRDIEKGHTITLFLGQNTWPTPKDNVNLAKCLAVQYCKPGLLTNLTMGKRPDYYDDLVISMADIDKEVYATNNVVSISEKCLKNLRRRFDKSRGFPKCVLGGSKEFVSTFIATLFTLKGSADKHGIKFSDDNPLFLRHFYSLLANFGIPASITNNTLIIEGKYALTVYLDKIGFISPTKELDLLKKIKTQYGGLLETTTEDNHIVWYEKITKELVEYVFSIISDERVYKCKTRTELLKICLEYKQVNNPYLDNLIYCLLNYQFLFVEVDTKTSIGKKTVYDITVDTVERFIGNGILQHNSTTFAMLASYQTHGFIKLQNASEFYGLMPTTILHGQLTALTWGSAIDLLWAPLLEQILGSPWYCIAQGQKVTLEDNTKKNIEDIKIGDCVKTLNGSSVVVDTHENGEKDCIEIEAGETTLTCTEEHTVYCIENGKIVEKLAGDIKEGDLIVCEKGSSVEIDGKKIKVAEVKSIKKVGKKKVYDISVLNDNNYYAQGLLVHNCGYHSLMTEVGNNIGEELFKLKDTFYLNRARRLQIAPLGPDRRKLRGRTDFLGGADELGLFDSADGSNKVKMNADEIYTSLKNSLRTVRSAWLNKFKQGNNFILPPILGSISSPMDKKDKIIRLYESRETQPQMYAFLYPTWGMNPHLKREDFDAEFLADPQRAMRDYGAVPPNSALPYIEDMDSVKPSISKTPSVLALKTRLDKVQVKSKNKTYEYFTADPVPLIPKDMQKRAMALDAGRSNNSFSMALGYYDDSLHRPIIDAVVELVPTSLHKINFSLLYDDFIRPVVDYFNVSLLVCDQWNSIKLLDDIQKDEGIESEQYSVKYSDFQAFKDDLTIGNISLPKNEMRIDRIENAGLLEYPKSFIGKPISHLLYQLITVQDTTYSVEKGVGSTDDNLRACVLLYSYLVDPDYHYLCSGNKQTSSRSKGFIASVGSLAIGSGSSSSAGGTISRNGGKGFVASITSRK